MGKRLDGRNVGFQLLPHQIDTLRAWAAKEDRSMSAVIRRLIDEEALRVEAGWVSPIGSKAPPVEVEGKS